jgi:hypothetical protein
VNRASQLNNSMRYVASTAFSVLVMTLLLPGCGAGAGDVSGVVKFQGKPLEGGTITFYDEYNGVRTSDIKEDGSYTVSKVATGTAKITVVTPMDLGMPMAKTIVIPPKYADRVESGLTCKVVGKVQKQNFDLE